MRSVHSVFGKVEPYQKLMEEQGGFCQWGEATSSVTEGKDALYNPMQGDYCEGKCNPTCALTECGPSISTSFVLKNVDI